jgi:hypothetical protein
MLLPLEPALLPPEPPVAAAVAAKAVFSQLQHHANGQGQEIKVGFRLKEKE